MVHFLVLSFPLHSHVNPTLEFARRLARAGARVTFLSSVFAYRRMIESPAPEGLSYASFSDGYDDGFNFLISNDSKKVTLKKSDASGTQFSEAGSRTMAELLHSFADRGCHVNCVVYSINQTWAADVARQLEIPSLPLWIQPAAVLAVYYHYFHDSDGLFKRLENDPDFLVELPKLPPMSSTELPSFLLPSNPYLNIRSAFQVQFETLDKEVKEEGSKPRVLINTFEALEGEALGSAYGLDLICIGPLIPSLPKKTKSETYMKWLDSRPFSSVVYVSFGSIIDPCKRQMEEILNGLLETGRPFLWVIKVLDKESESGIYNEILDRLSRSDIGLVVPWCTQVEVLSHPSTGCFVTHCGWNSTSESLAMGIPMVCFPQWTDQATNAKLVEDVWETGVRVKVNEEGTLEGGELKRYVEEVMGGERGEQIKKNARKWRDLVREAVAEGGSSDCNIRAFVEEMGIEEVAHVNSSSNIFSSKSHFVPCEGTELLMAKAET